jgi:hypothetical protein
MARMYKSEASMVIHDMAAGLYENGIINKITDFGTSSPVWFFPLH